MTYRLIYTRRAEKDIKALASPIRERIGKALLRYREDPFKHAERLTDFTLGGYRFRIGDYRVVFDIEEDKIVVLRVGHRREIYRLK